jgi:hypothetical protein
LNLTLDVDADVLQNGDKTVVEFIISSTIDDPIKVRFEIEKPLVPGKQAVDEAMLLATLALAMHRGSTLRLRGNVSRSLRHSVDLYQKACTYWWPHRYRKIPIEVDVMDDHIPVDAKGILCFSGGLDSIYSAGTLKETGLIDTGLLIAGYDLDNEVGQTDQRARVARLLERLGLTLLVIKTDIRQVLGQQVIEGAQGSYLATALTLLSDTFGRGLISSGLVNLSDVGACDPVHEAVTPLLGSVRFPISVYGGQVSRLEKLEKIAMDPELFKDTRVCLGRENDGHCGQCPKCVLNAFAIYAMTGNWPVWYPQELFDLNCLRSLRANETRQRFGTNIVELAERTQRRGLWLTTLKSWLQDSSVKAPLQKSRCPSIIVH